MGIKKIKNKKLISFCFHFYFSFSNRSYRLDHWRTNWASSFSCLFLLLWLLLLLLLWWLLYLTKQGSPTASFRALLINNLNYESALKIFRWRGQEGWERLTDRQEGSIPQIFYSNFRNEKGFILTHTHTQ